MALMPSARVINVIKEESSPFLAKLFKRTTQKVCYTFVKLHLRKGKGFRENILSKGGKEKIKDKYGCVYNLIRPVDVIMMRQSKMPQ